MRLRESPLGWAGLEGVCISHLHGDHILGLPGLLMSLGMAQFNRPLPIYGPPGIDTFIKVVLQTCRVQLPFPIQVHLIPPEGGILIATNAFSLRAIPLKHRVPCYGFFFQEAPRLGRFDLDEAQRLGVPPGPLYGRLQAGHTVTLENGETVRPEQVMGPGRAGRLVAYCTDTAPCRAVVEHSEGADMLIHDATFGRGLEQEARVSGHSTAEQAAEQARSAQCRRLTLTHISARYPDAALLVDQASAIFEHTIAAADLLGIEIPARDE